MTDNTDIIVFAVGVVVTFIFGIGAFILTRVSFSNAMKVQKNSQD